MFRPNLTCTVTKADGRNRYGESQPGASFSEPCAITKAEAAAKPTNSRAQLSGSQTHAEDLQITAGVMLLPTTRVALGDRLTVAGMVLRIVSLGQEFDTFGR